jgi:hypothetical protein
VTPPSVRLVSRTTAILDRRFSRRKLLTRAALVGSAVTTSGLDFVLRPGSAYASICGEGHTCGSAWTAMCCTINQGVNRCPPGSFAGGWWKAEGASLCGGKARYYIDCQAECTHCHCHGSAFCGEHCWNCTPHCPDHGGCDQRRVCHNLFRYGQCDRDRHCSGPVMCRAISCSPPWKWDNCSTTSATDDFTRTHSAPCLPTWTPIQERYTHLGSQGSVLGATVHGEHKLSHGHMQRYQHGRMYWSGRTGAHYLTGHILRHYVHLHETKSPLGFPTSDIEHTPHNGRGARFQHGGIFHADGRAAHAIWGPIWAKWLAANLYRGPLGYPTTDVTTGAHGKGRFAHFTEGSIYHGPGLAPHDLYGEIAKKYRKLGYETGSLGYPTSDQKQVKDVDGNPGVEVSFETGAIDKTPHDVPYAVWGPIYTTWAGQGGAAGALGFPTSDVVATDPTHQRCDFEHGYAIYDQTTGQVTVTLT